MIIEDLNIETLYGTYRLVEKEMPICEICGEEYELAYYDIDNVYVGCEECVTKVYE